MRTLILLTWNYPYGSGETFVEAELEILADVFDEILLVPSRTGGSVRPLPSGARLATARRGMHQTRQRLMLQAKALLTELAGQGGRLFRTSAAVQAPIFLMAARRRLRALQLAMSEVKYEGTRTVLYSYWLNAAALAAVWYAEQHQRETVAVARGHGTDIYEERHPTSYIPFRPAILGGLSRIFVVSEHGGDYLRERYPAATKRLRVARLGVPDPGFRAEGSRDGVTRVVSCSSIIQVKRLDRIVAGLAEVATRHPDRQLCWTHLGGGALADRILRLARRTLPSRISVRFAGHMGHDEVLEYYRQHPVDVFVNTSESEGLPVSIMEAMSVGIPVVAPDVGGNGEIVDTATGGLMPADFAPGTLASAIETVAFCEDRADRREGAVEVWANGFKAARNFSAFAQDLERVARGDA